MPVCYVQLFTDAARGSGNTGVGYGAIILGLDGKVCGTMEFMDPTLHTPLAAEVNAIIHGIRLLQRMDVSTVTIFSDSLVAITMI